MINLSSRQIANNPGITMRKEPKMRIKHPVSFYDLYFYQLSREKTFAASLSMKLSHRFKNEIENPFDA